MLKRDEKATGVTPFRMTCLIHPTLFPSQLDNFSHKGYVLSRRIPSRWKLGNDKKKLVENKYILFRLFVRAVVLGSGQYRCRLPLQVMGDPKQRGP